MTITATTGSGYLNNPPRTILISNDNRPGSYPVEISPVDAAKSSHTIRPYRDNIFPDTRLPYGQAQVIFTAVPNEGETVTLTNAKGQTQVFTFKFISNTFMTGPGSYDIAFDGISTSPRSGDEGLTRSQIITKRALEKFVQAVNAATGSLIEASTTSQHNSAILTQKIPGTAGNTANSTTSADVVIESFTGGNSGIVRYPFGIAADGSSEILQRVLSTFESGTLDVPAAGKASLLDAYAEGHSYGVFQPYDESNSHQSFGLPTGGSSYGTKVGLESEFFTRGSVSGSLDEPLSVKDKIVIDLSPSVETALLSTTGSAAPGPASNFPMAYFNFSTKRWEPIGFGRGRTTPAGATTLQENLERQYVGFSQAWGNYAVTSSVPTIQILDPQLLSTYTGTKNVFQETGWFTPIDTFGFPLHPKYHATGSQQLDVSYLVDKPFLVEKIVYEFSASMPHLTSAISPLGGTDFEYLGGGGVFFILNQRKANPDPGQENSYTNTYVSEITGKEFGTPQDGGINGPNGDFYSFRYENGGIPRSMQLSTSGPTVYVDTVRDLVTYARVGTVWDEYGKEISQIIEPGFPHPANFMDLAINVPASGSFSGAYTVASPVKAAFKNSAVSNIALGSALTPNNILSVWASKDSSTRNSIDISTGRAYRGEFLAADTLFRFPGFNTAKLLFSSKTDSSPSPYLLMPGDKLVFGWQSPTYYSISGATSNSIQKMLKILPGKGKLILYGSYLRDDKPVHNIYKDQINSDAIHEFLPSSPWVLDRFESDPQMMYSGSMREEHVTGTMLTKKSDGTLTVTNQNDFSIGGVRCVRARTSAGNLSIRYSFNRNNRIFDQDEQFYDSMQPNPIKILFKSGSTKALNFLSVGSGSLPIMLESERFYGPATLPNANTAFNQYANRDFIGKFPFEKYYAGIPRVKKINSRVFNKTIVPTWTYSLSDVVTVSPSGHLLDSIFFSSGSEGSGQGGGHCDLMASGSLVVGGIPYGTGNSWFVPVSTDVDVNPVKAFPLFGSPGSNDPIDDINYNISRFMGCFGDGYYRLPRFLTAIPDLGVLFFNVYLFVLLTRGCKHGLINPTPLFSSAIFNGTRYGQNRDMMEQRLYSRFSLGDSTLTDAAVSVDFINRNAGIGDNNIVSGSATNSSNTSKFATSEHPYDDARSDYGLIWDRDTPLPETLIAI